MAYPNPVSIMQRLMGGGGASGGGTQLQGLLGGIALTPQEAQDLATFLGLPASMAAQPDLLSEIIGLGGYDSRIAHMAASQSAGAQALAAQAAMLSAQSEAAFRRAEAQIAQGQLALARQTQAQAYAIEQEKNRLIEQAQTITAQMDYVGKLMSLTEKPEDAYRYEFNRYGLQAPEGGTGVPGLPVPDVVKSLFAQPQAGAPQAAPSTINPALTGIIPGATLNPQGQPAPGPAAVAPSASGVPQGYTGQMMTLSPYLQNLFAQAGKPTAGVPVGQPPPGYQYPTLGTPSAQSLRYLSPDQLANMQGYARDITGQPAAALTSSVDKLSPQGSGLSLPSDFGGAGASASTAESANTFGTGGLALHRTHALLAEKGVPEEVTPRPDLAALMGGPNIHGQIGPGLDGPPQADDVGPGLDGSGGAGGPTPASRLMAVRSLLHTAAALPAPAGAPGGTPSPPGAAGGPFGAPQAGGMTAPGDLGGPAGPGLAPPAGAPGGDQGMIPPPPGPGASLNFPPLPPMGGASPGIASMQMPTSRELGPNPTEPIMPKVPIPQGPLGPGSSGPNVTALQRALERLGYFKLPFGANYGNFGPHTTDAVARFQADHGHSPQTAGHHDAHTAALIRQRLAGYGKQPHGPNPAEMRGSDQHPTPAMTGTRSSGAF